MDPCKDKGQVYFARLASATFNENLATATATAILIGLAYEKVSIGGRRF